MANKGQIGLEVKEGKFLSVRLIALSAIERNYGGTQALHVDSYLAQLP
jgi:hypothetical protein